MTTELTIRGAVTSDAESLLALIDALADYEKLPRPDREARRRLVEDALGPSPCIEAFIAEVGGKAVAYALVFQTYSSFLARPTLYLEDIFVLPGHRNRKIGRGLFLAMTALARERGCGRMEWTVLDWNRPAIEFYKRFGARHMSEWQLFRLDRDDLERLGSAGELSLVPNQQDPTNEVKHD